MHFQWSVYESPIISWYLSLDKIKKGNTASLFDYLNELIHIVDNIGIYRLKQTSDGYYHNNKVNYFEHIARLYKEGKDFSLFSAGHVYVEEEDEDRADVFICYENENGLKQDWIEDIVHLRDKIAKKFDKEVSMENSKPPLSINGHNLTRKNIVSFEKIPFIVISLYSDIWFPWVLDWNSTLMQYGLYKVPKTFDDLFDNQLLARCNTLKLNLFIQAISNLTKNYGYVAVEPHNPLGKFYYAPMIKPDGTIDLDVKPANGRPASMYWLED